MKLKKMLLLLITTIFCFLPKSSYGEHDDIVQRMEVLQSLLGITDAGLREELQEDLKPIDDHTYSCHNGLTKICVKDNYVASIKTQLENDIDVHQMETILQDRRNMKLRQRIFQVPKKKWHCYIDVILDDEQNCRELLLYL